MCLNTLRSRVTAREDEERKEVPQGRFWLVGFSVSSSPCPGAKRFKRHGLLGEWEFQVVNQVGLRTERHNWDTFEAEGGRE